jgi:hypothetical protein
MLWRICRYHGFLSSVVQYPSMYYGPGGDVILSIDPRDDATFAIVDRANGATTSQLLHTKNLCNKGG